MASDEKDIFRDTWLRYLGYANEVGESFRAMIPRRVVRWSYQIAMLYCLADTVEKSFLQLVKDGRPTKVMIAAGDALIWQTLASVAIPGYIINRICAFSLHNFNTRPQLVKVIPPKLRPLLTAGVGISSIPFIVHPIDRGTDIFMDYTYRPFFGR